MSIPALEKFGERHFLLVGGDGRPYLSTHPGTLGGHRRTRLYGRLDCPFALRAIDRGGYVRNRVFFADEATAAQAGYRPCAVCLPAEYRAWKDGLNKGESGMSEQDAGVSRLLVRLEKSWSELQDSINGLSDDDLVMPRTMDEWSIRDMLAHVTTWEEQALEHLPTIIAGGRPPKYVTFGGIDAFNAMMTEKKRRLSIGDVKHQMADTHSRLVAFIRDAPVEQFSSDTRARRRLRWDAYGHYALHAKAIREWREANAEGG